MSKILIFSGTGDGRKMAENLAKAGHEIIVCVATEYGEQLMPQNPKIKVHCARMDEAHMHAFMASCNMDVVIDATHPYAKVVSENIKRVCERRNYVYYRLLRDSFSDALGGENIIMADDIVSAAKYLERHEGNIFVSTGSKEFSDFVENISDKTRIYVRVLPNVEVISDVNKTGILGSQIICMQGPFGEELNYAMFVSTNCKWLVTKESGSVGGFLEKINAAKRAGMKVVVIKRPVEQGYSANSLLHMLNVEADENIWNEKKTNIEADENTWNEKRADTKEIVIAGIGMGSVHNMTLEVVNAIINADIVIGASRMLDAAAQIFENEAYKPLISKGADTSYDLPEMTDTYKADEIVEKILANKNKNIVIVLSGDIGFYSGAKSLISKLESFNVKNIKVLPGISAPIYLASKINIAWEDMVLLSIHGRNQNVVDAVKHNEKVFALVGGTDGVSKLCNMLTENLLEDVEVFAASNLSYSNERIVKKSAKDLKNYREDGVSCVVIINKNAVKKDVTHGLSDDFFIRDKVPMTKEEVRCVSLSKMHLKEDSVIYDIGAGSGSVTIECALRASEGMVYAIERKDEAVELIQQNCHKAGVTNVRTIKACAPDIPEDIENEMKVPTHCFIGGTNGSLSQILNWIYAKNPSVRIVINAISLETISEIINELKRRQIEDAEIVCMNVSKAKKIGQYNMMMGNNPVYVVSF